VSVYDIVEVPATVPLTTPILFMVATLVVAELHTPPIVELLKAVVPPTKVIVDPLMAAIVGKEYAVNTNVAALSQPAALVILTK
jgi:hypothetical protein